MFSTAHDRERAADIRTAKAPTIDQVFALVRAELARAMLKHAPMGTAHHGRSVIDEEVEELWTAIKGNSPLSAAHEAAQVAATAIRFIHDLYLVNEQGKVVVSKAERP